MDAGPSQTGSGHAVQTQNFKFGKFTYGGEKRSNDEHKTHKFVKVINKDGDKLDVKKLVQAIKTKWDLKRPNLVISVTGGAWDFPMNRHVREVFRKGIVEAADSTNAVIITGGTNVGVMKYTGTAVKDYKMATGKGKKIVTLGIATWDKLRDDIKKGLNGAISSNTQPELTIQPPKGEEENGTLEPNHSHFILVEHGKMEWGADVPVRAEFEKQIKAMHEQPLGLEDKKIQDSQINCSSTEHATCNHSKARLNNDSAWTPDSSDKKQWIEIDLGVTKLVSEVVTQGNPDDDTWVTKYKVQYKVEKRDKWKFVTDDTEQNKILKFPGNSNRNSKRRNIFPVPIRASFIRLVPTKWKTNISMRFELRGSDDLPVVCILVEGGPNSIQQSCEAVEKGTPVVVVANSGRASDVLAYAFQEAGEKSDDDIENRLKTIIKEDEIAESKNLIKKAVHHSNMLNIYDAKSNIEIDHMILQALMKANITNIGLQVTLAQTWNRIDIVKDEIFRSLGETTDWERYNREIKETISGNFHQALIKNQEGFVKLYLDNGVVILENFITLDELKKLYVETKFKEDERVNEQNVLEKVRREIEDLTTLHFERYPLSSNVKDVGLHNYLQDPYRHLFIFAILNDFEEMAEYFWEEGQEHIASALVASKIYRSQAHMMTATYKEKRERFKKIEKKYDDLAYEVLDACESQSEKSDSPNIVLRNLPNWGEKTCLDLAEISGNRNFIAHSAVQTLLDEEIWSTRDGLNDTKAEKKEECCCIPYGRFIIFYIWSCLDVRTPKGRFCHNAAFYIMFLALFTYVMISDQLSNRWPAGWECFLIVWGITFVTEEIRQMGITIKEMKEYILNQWNWIDIYMLTSFVLGVILRLVNHRHEARIILAFSIFGFYFRLFHKLTFSKYTGPKVLMIGQMLIDLAVFMVILLIVLTGYGVAVQSVLYPHVTDHWTVFKEILYRPYFQIYGELFLEDIQGTADDCACSKNETAISLGATPCPQNTGWGIVFLALYMVFSNVLLLNLLIAMFSHTFDKVEEENDVHWKFLRYSLTKEYFNRPFLAPPLIILVHIYRLTRFCLGNWTPAVMVRKLSEEDDARTIKMEQRCGYEHILSKRRKQREYARYGTICNFHV
ncbi:transient receptor potential cation channel subfamily M member-like 2 [Amphiura filiformis]|uniref:transient receptor potential cation channel subfamily M member-like 2 n=1 Tax=Amphiura filiformis TaxID=82378 RepID=UPI003B20E459